ncbi:hypothetical protein [Streptomyces atratus]|uniref:hypothetical protein n=1 Tax=Streptomyces atratus TaxID=1893 RepID=UPI00379C465A
MSLFRTADSARPATTPATVGMTTEDIEDAREQAAAVAGLKTPLEAAGLSPRAVSVAASLGASTVGALLDVPPHTISRARGAGNAIRKELNRRHRQWSHDLRKRPEPREPAAIAMDAPEEALESVETLAARLMPAESQGRRTKPRPDVVRATLQLPGGADLGDWPAQTAIAKALDISQNTVSQHQLAAVERWAGLPWMDRVRDELAAILSEQGRVMTAVELVDELRVRHGAGDGDAADTSARSLAVVRAAVDTEARKRDEDAGSEPPARLAMLRRDGRVLLALEDQPGADEPTPAELADYAAALGVVAADVAVRDPLPGRVTVLRELRAVGAPEGMIPLADTRLVDLAAAMARGVGVSPRLELYPLGLDLFQALRISQAAAEVRPDTGIGTDDLLARVRARFPALAVLADTTYVELEEALDRAGFPFAYDQQRKRFLPRGREAVAWHTEQTVSALASTRTRIEDAQSELALGRDPRRVRAARLQAARRPGGFVALTVKGPELPGAAERLAERFDVTPLALDELLLTTLRELAQEQRAPWQALLKADAAFAASGSIGAGLASYARLALERVVARVAELAAASGPRTVLLAHRAGLVARYWEVGGRELLVALQNAAAVDSMTPDTKRKILSRTESISRSAAGSAMSLRRPCCRKVHCPPRLPRPGTVCLFHIVRKLRGLRFLAPP